MKRWKKTSRPSGMTGDEIKAMDAFLLSAGCGLSGPNWSDGHSPIADESIRRGDNERRDSLLSPNEFLGVTEHEKYMLYRVLTELMHAWRFRSDETGENERIHEDNWTYGEARILIKEVERRQRMPHGLQRKQVERSKQS